MTAFNYTSGNVNNLDAGDSLNMLDIKGPLQDIPAFLNGRTFNEDNLPVSLLQRLGLNDASGQKGRGKSVIAQSESRTNTAYGTLTTPDQVAGIVLPTDGLIFVTFRATWQESVAGAARAALFIGATQVQRQTAAASGQFSQEADLGGATNTNAYLTSHPGGLASGATTGGSSAVATTGQLVGLWPDNTDTSAGWGGPAVVEAAAGTYTISVQFKSSSGSVTASNRKLWVWTVGF